MTSMDEIKQTFFEECDEQLTELEVGLLEVQDGNHDLEKINEIFRAVHSIKGGAGAFGLETLVQFAHVFENTLDLIRSEQLEPSDDALKAMLKATDILFDLVNAAKTDTEISKATWGPLAEELAAINETVSTQDGDAESSGTEVAADEPEDFDTGFAPLVISLDEPGEDLIELPSLDRKFVIEFKPQAEMYDSANEPILILRELAALGQAEINCDSSAIPLLDEMDVDGAFLSWTITLVTEHGQGEIRELFEFVEDVCTLKVEEEIEDAVEVDISDLVALAKQEPDEEIAAEIEPPKLEIVPGVEKKVDEPEVKPVETKEPAEKNIQDKKPKVKAKATTASATVRVDVERIDKLINLVGELVITQSMLSLRATKSLTENNDAIKTGLDELEQLTRDIQDGVMAIRAQPVKSMFQRMSRVAREAAAATGKQIALVMQGEATEVDKTVIEKLADPLTHMIRNGADHGLESTEDRLAAGKPEEGTITLSASHRSGRVIIEVSDDGAGINREKVRKIAEERGLVSPESDLSDFEIDNLIFMPGFSTVDEVSALSGRGVGMDVVKNSIQSLGGKVSITSTPGKGSTFTMSLPLTLAVLEGMIVSVKEQTFVIPLTAVTETLRLEDENLHTIGNDAAVVSIRDKFVPIIDVGCKLGITNQKSDKKTGVLIMIESESSSATALLVDEIQDQRQVVIKSLDSNYGNVQDIAAATVLGDGRVALILDVEAIVDQSSKLPEDEIILKQVG